MRFISTALLVLGLAPLSACSSHFLGGAAVGAGGTGAAYEFQNKQALDDLDEDYEHGRIGREEYLERKHDIEERSVIY